MKLPRRCVTHCDSSSPPLYPSISAHTRKKKSDGEMDQTQYGVRPVFLSLPLPRLPRSSLECSLWPSHWQMLLWNVMKFETGAAVTIILGQGLSLAWYHYRAIRTGCEGGGREGEMKRWQAVSYMLACVWKAGKQTRGSSHERRSTYLLQQNYDCIYCVCRFDYLCSSRYYYNFKAA